MTKEEKVIDKLLGMSTNNNNWEEAQNEWSLSMVFKLYNNDQCLCGTPIQYVCLIENGTNLSITSIGSSCYEEIFKDNSAKRLINDLKRISKDSTKTVHSETLEWLRKKNYIQYKYTSMYDSISKKKDKSYRQKEVIKGLNKRIIKLFSCHTFKMRVIARKILLRNFPDHIQYDKTFVTSIDEQLRYTGSLSPKQEDSLLFRAEKLGMKEVKT